MECRHRGSLPKPNIPRWTNVAQRGMLVPISPPTQRALDATRLRRSLTGMLTPVAGTHLPRLSLPRTPYRREKMLIHQAQARTCHANNTMCDILASEYTITSSDVQAIAILREELEVLQRLSRAQDRKFKGSEGYSMARRLWEAEEELRVSRSTISALGAEVRRRRGIRET